MSMVRHDQCDLSVFQRHPSPLKIDGRVYPMSCRKRWIVVIIFVTCSFTSSASAQTSMLKVSLFESDAISTDENDHLRALFNDMLSKLHVRYPTISYTSIDMAGIDYQTPCGALKTNTLASLTAMRYQACKKELGEKLKPLLSVKKVHDPDPYYSATFITNRQSQIDSLESSKIHTLYLVDSESASGYIAPLYKLYEIGLIKSPSLDGVKEKGWNVEVVGRHPEVINRIKGDFTAIGAVGNPSLQSAQQSDIVLLLRYYTLPQDVIVISSDLDEYKEGITEWFTAIFNIDSSGAFVNPNAKVLENSSARITGVAPFSRAVENAITDLGRMHDHVVAGKGALPLTNLNKGTSVADLLNLVNSLTVGALVATLMSVFTVLSSAFGLGYRLGRKPTP